jgi:hypothetical protein
VRGEEGLDAGARVVRDHQRQRDHHRHRRRRRRRRARVSGFGRPLPISKGLKRENVLRVDLEHAGLGGHLGGEAEFDPRVAQPLAHSARGDHEGHVRQLRHPQRLERFKLKRPGLEEHAAVGR